MTLLLRTFLAAALAALSLSLVATSLQAQEAAAAPSPQTLQADDIAVEVLKVRLRPQTSEELEKLAQAWQGKLQQKAEEIANEESIALSGSAEEKIAAVERATELREERAEIVARLNVILDAWEKKGGDPSSVRSYIAAVSGSGLDSADLTDVNQVWTMIRTWVTSKEGGVKWGMNILKFLGTLLVFRFIARIVARIAKTAVSRIDGASTLLKNFIVRMSRTAVMLIGFIMALAMIEVPVSPLVAALGAAGLVIGLALQGTLSNFAAGILILIYRPFDVGSVVEVAGETGSVKAMNIFSTILHTADNKVVMIPNGTIWGGTITNLTGNPTRRVDLVFGIGYSDDIDRAKAVLTEILEKHPATLQEPKPKIEVHELADSSVNFVARPWVKTEDYWGTYWDITAEVKRRFDAEGISIPFPQRDVHVHQVGD
jgi:small conductance mechanosensitive channel